MIFSLIYGKSGSGKTAYIFNKIKEILDANPNQLNEKVFLIVPEQSNLMAEANLIKATGRTTLMGVEVLTLSRMQSRLEQESSNNQLTHLSKIGKSMLIYDLLGKNKLKLNFLGKTSKNVDSVCQMIIELKKHNISLEDLQNLKYQDKYQELKFNDIMLLYGGYQQTIQNKMIDENDRIAMLAEQIKDSTLLDNSHIFIDDFDGFTLQEFSVAQEIIKKAKSVTVTCCADDINVLTNPENDIFYYNKLFALKFAAIAEQQGAQIEKIHLVENYKSQNTELKVLEQVFSTFDCVQYKEEVPNIKLKLANDTYQELENIAKTIVDLVKNQGYRFNEIAIITDDTDKYSADCKAIFNQYKIPVFIDEKKKLNQNVLIQFILSMFDIFNKNYSYESMFSYIKSDLLNIDSTSIYGLENYCRKWGIRGNKWFEEFAYKEISDEQNHFEEIRKQIMEPLISFKSSVQEDKTVNQMVKCLYEFLIQNGIDLSINKIINNVDSTSLSDEYSTSYDLLVGILDEMILCFDRQKIGFEKFKDLLQIGLENTELGIIPATQDQVILGDSSRSRNHNIRALFIVGVNDGTFPKDAREEGFINDADRSFLRDNGLSVAKDSMELLYDEQYQVYKTFTIPSEKLFISYCSTDVEGKSIRPSITIKKIKRIFEKLQEESLITQMSELNSSDNLIGFTNQASDISDDNIKKLYGNTINLSVSKLEKYKQCPFQFHMEYGLKLKEREKLDVQLADTGSFMHEVIDEFFKKVDAEGYRIKELSEEQIVQIARPIIEQMLERSRFYMLSGSPKFRRLTQKLKKTVIESIKYIVNSLRVSDFDVYGTEVTFDSHSEIKQQIIELDNGQKVELTGKIDRVDLGKIDDKTYVRVIDYKSSFKQIDSNLVEAGIQLQLLTYIDVMEQEKGFDPAGVLYFGLKDELIKVNDSRITEEEIEQNIIKSFRMSGLLVADVRLIRAMDKTIPDKGGTSQVIPARITSQNELYKSKSQVSKDDFINLQKTTKRLIKQISKEILKGQIEIKPYKYDKRTGCDYCKYHAICNFTPGLFENEYNYIAK